MQVRWIAYFPILPKKSHPDLGKIPQPLHLYQVDEIFFSEMYLQPTSLILLRSSDWAWFLVCFHVSISLRRKMSEYSILFMQVCKYPHSLVLASSLRNYHSFFVRRKTKNLCVTNNAYRTGLMEVNVPNYQNPCIFPSKFNHLCSYRLCCLKMHTVSNVHMNLVEFDLTRKPKLLFQHGTTIFGTTDHDFHDEAWE